MRGVGALVGLVFVCLPALGQERLYPLMIGDPAPPLTVKEWIKGEPVAALDGGGRIHVLEFWATWCAPCREGMPHLTELQRKYKDSVTVIGVDVWELEQADVAPFVKKNEARMGYTVAMDDVPDPPPELAAEAKNHTRWATQNGRMSLGWLKASGWMDAGIPVAFIVDGRGRVAWMGNPTEMDGPLERIVAGTWDLDREAAAYAELMKVDVKARALWREHGEARRAKDWERAIAACDAGLALGPRHAEFAGRKFRALLLDLKQPERAYAFAREAVRGVAKDNWPALGEIASIIVYEAEGERDLDLALDAAQRGDKAAEGRRPWVIDALARAYFLKGDAASAAREQTRALGLAHTDDMRRESQSRLEEYQKAGGR